MRAIGEGEADAVAATAANDDDDEDDDDDLARDFDSQALPENYCIIEGRNSVVDFADMQAGEIAQNIESRRQRLFLLMEELRRLRVQQRVKTIGLDDDEVKETRELSP